MHEFLCTRNAICMHVMCTVLTVHAIYEGLFKFRNRNMTIMCDVYSVEEMILSIFTIRVLWQSRRKISG